MAHVLYGCHPTGIGPQRDPGMFSASASMAGYPKNYNIEMDPQRISRSARFSGGRLASRLRSPRNTRNVKNIRTRPQAT